MTMRTRMILAGLVAVTAAAPAPAAQAATTCQGGGDGGPVLAQTTVADTVRLFAQDQAYGWVSCTSNTAASFTATVTASVQWFDGTAWHDVPGCRQTGSQDSDGTGGATATAGPVLCTFGSGSPYLDRHHRALIAWSAAGVTRSQPSATWYQPKG